MEALHLTVQQRDLSIPAKKLRQSSIIPLVAYGHNKENLHLQVDYQTFYKVFKKATYSTLINLTIEGKKDSIPMLVHQVQYDPVYDTINHVDIKIVNMEEKVETHVAIEFIGSSEAVKQGGALNTTKTELHITCLPKDLVHTISVDLTPLDSIGKSVRVKDITPPAGVEILDGAEEPIVSAVELKVSGDDSDETNQEAGNASETEKTEENQS